MPSLRQINEVLARNKVAAIMWRGCNLSPGIVRFTELNRIFTLFVSTN
jgi:hypothetical protein